METNGPATIPIGNAAEKGRVVQLEIRKITRDPTMQPREKIDQTTVIDYAERIKEGENFPPVDVFHDGERYWIADGWHRLSAHDELRRRFINAVVHDGDRRDAMLFSIQANTRNGKQMTAEDRRRCVRLMLDDPECATWANTKIGKYVGVNESRVRVLKQEWIAEKQAQEQPVPESEFRERTRNGKTELVHVSEIGSKQKTTLAARETAAIQRRAAENRLAFVNARINTVQNVRDDLEKIDFDKAAVLELDAWIGKWRPKVAAGERRAA